MSNNKIMQFSYLRKLNRPARKRRYFTLESAITARLRDVPRKLHHGILFAPPLLTDIINLPFGMGIFQTSGKFPKDYLYIRRILSLILTTIDLYLFYLLSVK